jgi:hypothetical protein
MTLRSNAYAEDIDETFGLKRTQRESDADRVIFARHDHDWCHRRVAVGSGVCTRDDVRSLLAVGITHVVDCRVKTEAAALYAGTGIRWVHCPAKDDGEPKPVAWFHPGVTFALDAIRGDPRAKALVHCDAGINRGPSMAYAILRAMGIKAGDAERKIRRARPRVRLPYLRCAERYIAT